MKFIFIIFTILISSCFHSEKSEDSAQIVNVTPKNNSQGVYIGEEITIEFDRKIQYKKIKVKYNDAPMRVKSINTDGTKLRLIPIIPLEENSSYKISVTNIIDADMSLPVTNHSWTFETTSTATFENTKLISGALGKACLLDQKFRYLLLG